jgi:hypothetical protein
MWDGVLKTFKEVLAKAEATYLAKAKSGRFSFRFIIYTSNEGFFRLQLH